MSNYKTLLFDLDDTLMDFKKAESHALKKVLVNNGIPNDDKTIGIYSDINLSYWKKYERGEIERDEIFPGRFGTFLKQLELPHDPMEINRQYALELRNGYFLLDGALELLTRLSGKYQMHIITNGVAVTQHSRINGSGIRPFFEHIFISEEIGARKPSKEYFDYVLNTIGNPDRATILVIGDSLSGDIQGGINAGLDTCWANVRHNQNTTSVHPNYEIKTLPELYNILGE